MDQHCVITDTNIADNLAKKQFLIVFFRHFLTSSLSQTSKLSIMCSVTFLGKWKTKEKVSGLENYPQ